jgi:hypothetical protein
MTESHLTIGPTIMTGDITPRAITFPLQGKTLFTIKADGTIERGEGFTTEDEMSLHFWAMIEKLGLPVVVPRKIEYSYADNGSYIVTPPGPPFDGKPVLILLASGWCEARWQPQTISRTLEGDEPEGFYWVCMDDDFQADFDDAKYWLPLPPKVEDPK